MKVTNIPAGHVIEGAIIQYATAHGLSAWTHVKEVRKVDGNRVRIDGCVPDDDGMWDIRVRVLLNIKRTVQRIDACDCGEHPFDCICEA